MITLTQKNSMKKLEKVTQSVKNCSQSMKAFALQLKEVTKAVQDFKKIKINYLPPKRNLDFLKQRI
jgi:chaperonin cofactor prefoldin